MHWGLCLTLRVFCLAHGVFALGVFVLHRVFCLALRVFAMHWGLCLTLRVFCLELGVLLCIGLGVFALVIFPLLSFSYLLSSFFSSKFTMKWSKSRPPWDFPGQFKPYTKMQLF